MIKKYIEKKKNIIDEYLDKNLISNERLIQTIISSMRHSILAGGKRIRPILCIMMSEIFGDERDRILPVACSLEMIHTYSLIHDDLPAIDNDDLRRGKPSNHKVYGEAMAVLAGDALLTLAFNWISNASFDNHIIVKVLKEVSHSIGITGMIGGQVADIEGEDKETNEDTLLFIHSNKTAELIKCSAVIGAVCADFDSNIVEAVRSYGYNIGLAFQIIDDVLDVTGDSKKLGKMTGKDKKLNKITFPSVYGVEKSKKMAELKISEAKSAIRRIHNRDLLNEFADLVLNRDS